MGSVLGTHVHPWRIHVDVWQNQYNIVKKNKVKFKKMQILRYCLLPAPFSEVKEFSTEINLSYFFFSFIQV